MSGIGVDGNEMPFDPIDDESLEAFLSGRRPAELGQSLAAFAEELDVIVTGPPPTPRANLAALLREGFTPAARGGRVEAGAPVPPGPTPEPSPDSAHPWMPREWAPVPRPLLTAPQESRPEGGTRRLRLVPRLAGLGLAAKVGLGLGVAAASVTGAGVAGVLPDPVQHVVATVVDNVTPFDVPDPKAGPVVEVPGGGTLSGGPGSPGAAPTGKPASGGTRSNPGGTSGSAPPGKGSQGRSGVNPPGGPPSSLPTPATTLFPGQRCSDRVNQTPAADNVPPSVPGPPTTASPGQKGRDQADDTPAGTRRTTSSSSSTTSSSTTTTAPPSAGC